MKDSESEINEAGHYSEARGRSTEVSRVHPVLTDPLLSVNHEVLTPWRISKGRKLRLISNKLKICHGKQYKDMHGRTQDRNKN